MIAASDLRIDATALHKPKAQPHFTTNPVYFYKMANFLHFKYLVPLVATKSDELMVVASALQIKKKRGAVSSAVADVIQQVSPTTRYVTAFFRNDTDPCLQLADYAAWAIQRKLERNDSTWFDMISHNVKSVFEPWKVGNKTYY